MNTSLKSVRTDGTKLRSSSDRGKHAHDHLDSRQSQELLIGLSGPVGSGINNVKSTLENALVARGYRVVHIKISEHFFDEANKHGISPKSTPEESKEFNRIWGLQSLGNELREALGDDVGAQLAMRSIAIHRVNDNQEVTIPEIEPKKVAYVVDQLKHPKEVALLRSVYRNIFYMIGVLCSYDQRKKNLTNLGLTKPLAEKLMERDRKESGENGQQLEKTLQHAEFFVSNSKNNIAELELSLKRFVGLIHGDNGLTPTPKERGMFAAYSASLQSACLSRQVGAAIADRDGNVIATGCNDVPKAGGGLYEPGPGDLRCVFKEGICYNDKYKDDLKRSVVRILVKEGIKEDQAEKIADAIKSNTRIKDLIEFSRAVHAEMDAIVSVARKGHGKVEGATMYTTTYPCHNCARHIVAAGISTVYFIEPYEKSLAADLHDDSIAQEPDSETGAHNSKKVAFMHFEGVSPRKFTKLFHSSSGRKTSDGRAAPQIPDAAKKIPEYLDDYIELETRVVVRLESFKSTEKPQHENT